MQKDEKIHHHIAKAKYTFLSVLMLLKKMSPYCFHNLLKVIFHFQCRVVFTNIDRHFYLWKFLYTKLLKKIRNCRVCVTLLSSSASFHDGRYTVVSEYSFSCCFGSMVNCTRRSFGIVSGVIISISTLYKTK